MKIIVPVEVTVEFSVEYDPDRTWPPQWANIVDAKVVCDSLSVYLNSGELVQFVTALPDKLVKEIEDNAKQEARDRRDRWRRSGVSG